MKTRTTPIDSQALPTASHRDIIQKFWKKHGSTYMKWFLSLPGKKFKNGCQIYSGVVNERIR